MQYSNELSVFWGLERQNCSVSYSVDSRGLSSISSMFFIALLFLHNLIEFILFTYTVCILS